MKKALVAGALGVTGRTLVNHLVSLGDWEVIGLSRRSPEFQTSAKYIAVDLCDRSAVESKLRDIGDVTHVFYSALYWGKSVFDEVGPNLAMLTNLVETVERSSTQFRKVVLFKAPNGTARTSVLTRHPPGRMISGICRQIFIMIRRITLKLDRLVNPGPGQRYVLPRSAGSRWVTQ